MIKTKVRFNLGRGPRYMKWKINHPDGSVEYLSPTEVQLVMTNCELKNNKESAQKIYNGHSKFICAWLLCDKLEVRYKDFNQSDIMGKRLRYNPRVAPNWLMCKVDIDGTRHSRIESVDFRLYKVK